MSIFDKLSLGVNTTVIGMGIVFIVLIFLWILVVIESKIIKVVSDNLKSDKNDKETEADNKNSFIEKRGKISGETFIEGIDDDEIIAIIMSVVSNDIDIPLSELKFISIKAV